MTNFVLKQHKTAAVKYFQSHSMPKSHNMVATQLKPLLTLLENSKHLICNTCFTVLKFSDKKMPTLNV